MASTTPTQLGESGDAQPRESRSDTAPESATMPRPQMSEWILDPLVALYHHRHILFPHTGEVQTCTVQGELFPYSLGARLVKARAYVTPYANHAAELKDGTRSAAFRTSQLRRLCRTLQRVLFRLCEVLIHNDGDSTVPPPSSTIGTATSSALGFVIMRPDRPEPPSTWKEVQGIVFETVHKVVANSTTDRSGKAGRDQPADDAALHAEPSQDDPDYTSMLCELLWNYVLECLRNLDTRASSAESNYLLGAFPTPLHDPSLMLAFPAAAFRLVADAETCIRRIDEVIVRGFPYMEHLGLAEFVASGSTAVVAEFVMCLWSRFLYPTSECVRDLVKEHEARVALPSQNAIRAAEHVLLTLKAAIALSDELSDILSALDVPSSAGSTPQTPSDSRDETPLAWSVVLAAVNLIIRSIWSDLISPLKSLASGFPTVEVNQPSASTMNPNTVAIHITPISTNTQLHSILFQLLPFHNKDLTRPQIAQFFAIPEALGLPHPFPWPLDVVTYSSAFVSTCLLKSLPETNIPNPEGASLVILPFLGLQRYLLILNELLSIVPRSMQTLLHRRVHTVQTSFERLVQHDIPSFVNSGYCPPRAALMFLRPNIELYAEGWKQHVIRLALTGLLDAGPEGSEEAVGSGAAFVGGGAWARIRSLSLKLQKQVLMPSPGLLYTYQAIRQAIRDAIIITPFVIPSIGDWNDSSHSSHSGFLAVSNSTLLATIASQVFSSVLAEACATVTSLTVSRHNVVYQRADLAFLTQVASFALGFCARVHSMPFHRGHMRDAKGAPEKNAILRLGLPWVSREYLRWVIEPAMQPADSVPSRVTESAQFAFLKSYAKLAADYLRTLVTLLLLHAPAAQVSEILLAVHTAERSRVAMEMKRQSLVGAGESSGTSVNAVPIYEAIREVQCLRFTDAVLSSLVSESNALASRAISDPKVSPALSLGISAFAALWEGEQDQSAGRELSLGFALRRSRAGPPATLPEQPGHPSLMQHETPRWTLVQTAAQIFPDLPNESLSVPAAPRGWSMQSAVVEPREPSVEELAKAIGYAAPAESVRLTSHLVASARLVEKILNDVAHMYETEAAEGTQLHAHAVGISEWITSTLKAFQSFVVEDSTLRSAPSSTSSIQFPPSCKVPPLALPEPAYFPAQLLHLHTIREKHLLSLAHSKQIQQQVTSGDLSMDLALNRTSLTDKEQIERGLLSDVNVRIQAKRDAAPDDDVLSTLCRCLLLEPLTTDDSDEGSGSSGDDTASPIYRVGRALLDHVGSYSWFISVVSMRHDILHRSPTKAAPQHSGDTARHPSSDNETKSKMPDADKPPLTPELEAAAVRLYDTLVWMLKDFEAFWREKEQTGELAALKGEGPQASPRRLTSYNSVGEDDAAHDGPDHDQRLHSLATQCFL